MSCYDTSSVSQNKIYNSKVVFSNAKLKREQNTRKDRAYKVNICSHSLMIQLTCKTKQQIMHILVSTLQHRILKLSTKKRLQQVKKCSKNSKKISRSNSKDSRINSFMSENSLNNDDSSQEICTQTTYVSAEFQTGLLENK